MNVVQKSDDSVEVGPEDTDVLVRVVQTLECKYSVTENTGSGEDASHRDLVMKSGRFAVHHFWVGFAV